jgi:hypothetical protein
MDMGLDEARHDERIAPVVLDFLAGRKRAADRRRGSDASDASVFDRDDRVGFVTEALGEALLERVAREGEERAADRTRCGSGTRGRLGGGALRHGKLP